MTWAIQKLTLRNSLYENMIALGFLNTEMKAYPSPQPRKKQLPVKYVALSDTEQIFIAAEQRPHPVPKLRKGSINGNRSLSTAPIIIPVLPPRAEI